MMADGRVSPFSNGIQFSQWVSSNCDRCTKAYDEASGAWRCPIQEALDAVYLDDGSVSPEIAARMGATSPANAGRYAWPCGEIDYTEAWKAEWRHRQTLRYRAGRFVATRWRRLREWLRKTYAEARRRLLWPIAEKYGNDDPDGCWAEWATWAMGYTGRPSKASGAGCKIKPGESGSCWCGKNRSPDIEEGLARQAAEVAGDAETRGRS
jgi:hypothetical protein